MFDLETTHRSSQTLFPGVYAAVVKDHGVEGELKVSVPAVFEADDPAAHVIARPCFPYGHFFVPEIGEFVWVTFEGGDPRAPVWLGVFYPRGARPAQADTGSDPPRKRVIKTLSGHVVVFDDTSGSEAITLTDKTGNAIELRHDGVLIKCAQDLTIDASGKTVTITADEVNVTKG
jgi:Type VI secretion system/phage-baseplate injector OB domain